MKLYDYIYIDIEKVVSLYSQLTGGLVELLEINTDQIYTADNKRGYNLKVFTHNAGGTNQDRNASKSVMKPHHFIVTDLEEQLTARRLLVDLTATEINQSLRDENLRELLKARLFIKIKGRAIIEDYERMKSVTQNYPAIANFINKCVERGVRQSREFLVIQENLKTIDERMQRERDKTQRPSIQKERNEAKLELERLVQTAKAEVVEQWVLDGFKTWVDAFLPGIVNFRLYPFVSATDEHVFGHLRKNFFQDADVGSFHFTYGSMPTEELTLVGIVTSVPREHVDDFTPLSEFDKPALSEYESVESGFRNLFRGFDGIEQMIRTCRFPRVMVQPLTIYRSVDVPDASKGEQA